MLSRMMMCLFCPTFFLENLLNLLCGYSTFCYLAELQGLHVMMSVILPLVQLGQWPRMCGLCVFLNATSLSKMALYYPDRRTLASYCADHGKMPFSIESLLIKVPFSLITSQLVEVAGCASFPSCSYEDSLSSLIMTCVKSRMSQNNL